jgi:hypothetical protein
MKLNTSRKFIALNSHGANVVLGRDILWWIEMASNSHGANGVLGRHILWWIEMASSLPQLRLIVQELLWSELRYRHLHSLTRTTFVLILQL